jgi:DNA-binding transcriptional LysR family regulator
MRLSPVVEYRLTVQLRDIEYFAVVAEHGSIRRASEALDLSPAALSKSVQRLERSLGTKLVHRIPKGVQLTAVGSALVTHVSRLRLTMNDVTREAADLSGGYAGHLRVGVSPIECEDLPAACALLLKESAKISIELEVNDNDVLLPRLCKGELDVVFNFIGAAPRPGTVHEHLYEDTLVVCASVKHRLAKAKRVELADVVNERWAVESSSHLWVQTLQHVLRDNGLPAPTIAMEARSLRVRLHLWSCTDLLGLTTKRILRQAARSFRIKEIPVKALKRARPVGAIYRKDGYLPPAARRLIDLLKANLSKAEYPS